MKKNEKIEYVGKLARRGAVPEESEFVTILSGDSISEVVNVGENYEFSETGKYTVRLDLPLYSELDYTPSTEQVVSVELLSIPERNIPVGRPYTNCNSNQINQILASIDGSITESARANACLRQRTCESQAVTWFGTYSQSNRNFDINVFTNVNARLNNYEFSGYCNPAGCGSNVYAYVYPTDSTYTVYLCGLFWSIPAERTNTIVHEMSHFRTLGGTNDYAYGKTNCRNLASSDPFRATRNADNVCYFSETV